MTEAEVAHRRAIEALRAGVPNRDAVRALGCSQPHIEEKFREQLAACREGAERIEQARGLLIAGDFGTGKSHLLEHLHHLALEQNFVSSKVVISKETPLFDPTKLYRAAIDAAVLPDKQGSALREITETLDKSAGYPSFYQRVTSDNGEFDSRFAATLHIYEHVRIKDLEQRDRVISFWAGHKLNISEIKKYLRQCGAASTYRIGKLSARDLALQRFRFATQLMLAAGYAGWVLLIDEVELIARYSPLQRAKSYAEFARWTGVLRGEAFPGLLAVFSVTPDLVHVLLELHNDLENIPARLDARGTEADQVLKPQAERGMREIQKSVQLKRPNQDEIEAIGEKLRQVHAQAYRWSPPGPPAARELMSSGRLRTYVRACINQWDLDRLYPGRNRAPEVGEVQPRHTEDPDLVVASEPDEDSDSATDQP